jgi:LacI family transcriptional regulator
MLQIIVESSYGSIWRELMDGISFYVRERRKPWQLHCVTTEEIPAALGRRPAGLMCILRGAQNDLLAAVARSRIPAVNMLRNLHPAVPSVLSDHHAIGVAAADYFLSRGFHHFAFLGLDRDWSRGRLQGYRDRLGHKKLPVLTSNVPLTIEDLSSVTSKRLLRALQSWLSDLPKPLALFCAADFIARTAAEACRRRFRVPEEIAILGVDNDPAICGLDPVPLSSIPQNLQRIGFEAARLLDRLLTTRGRPRAAIEVAPREIVVRRSTDFVAVDDHQVAEALRYIHSAPIGSLTMKDLVRELDVSRQWLDRRFKLFLQRTPSEEIRRRKLAAAQALLLETSLPIQVIARRCGFTHGENLTRFFTSRVGMAPTLFRARNGLR